MSARARQLDEEESVAVVVVAPACSVHNDSSAFAEAKLRRRASGSTWNDDTFLSGVGGGTTKTYQH